MVTVDNPGPTDETYQLNLIGLDPATAANLPQTLMVPGGSSAEIELPVTALFEEGLELFIIEATDDDGVMGSDDALLDVVGETGVELSLTPTGDAGGPDTPISYELSVTNTGDFIDTYDLEVDLPAGWTFEWLANGQIVDPLTLIPSEFDTATIGLLITPAAGTAPGSYPFLVSATSTIYPSATDTISDQLEVLGNGVTVEITPGSTTINPLAPAVWDVTVTNTGIAADTFDLSTLGLGGETGQFSTSVLSLAAGQSNTVQLTIDAPDFLISGPIYKLHVAAVSQTDSRISNYALAEVELSGFDGVAIEWLDEAQSVDAGQSIDYFVTVTNTGNISETFTLTMLPNGGSGDHVALQAELDSIVLPAGFAGTLRVTAETTTAASGSFTLEASASNGQVSATDTATLTIQSMGESDLTGSLTLQGRSEHSIDLTLKVYALDDSVNPLYTFETSSSAAGEFSVGGILPGTYQMAVKTSMHLQRVQEVTLLDGTNIGTFGEQLAGDANSDNEVTLVDFSLLADAFNTLEGELDYFANADFNGDQTITLVDFSLLADNFNTVGEEVPAP
ncbi:MAG: dockerin type I domain-containing protein [Chloroflexota bacterium]